MRHTQLHRIGITCARLIMVLVLVALPANTAQSQTTRPDTAWITYTDTKFKVSATIPAAWHVTPAPDDGAGGTTSFTTFSPTSRPAGMEVPNSELKLDIGVASLDKPSAVSLVDWVKQNQLGGSRVLSERAGHRSGYEYSELEVAATGNRSARLWYFDRDGIIYFAIAMPRDSAYLRLAQDVVNSLVFSTDRNHIQKALDTDPSKQVDAQARQPDAPGGYRLPFDGKQIITSGPGCYYTHTGVSSEALDYSLSYETVLAAQDGEVIFSQDGWNDGFGSLIKVRHPDGNVSWHAHLNSRYKSSGGVSQGDPLGQSGNSGNSEGAHLHFEVRNASNQSIWIRDLPTTTWYTGDINNPCMPPGQYDGEATPSNPPQCSDGSNPDGDYSEPGKYQQVADSVHLKGWAKDDCGVDYVQFTATWPGQGWKVIKRVDTDCSQGATCTYEYDWNLSASGVPDGWITLGYDIYDKSGKSSLSPHGTRQILKVGSCNGPGLSDPANGWRTHNHTITFRWNDVSCSHTGYRLRVKTVSDMDYGGQTLADVYVSGTEQALSFGSEWENQALYWAVKAENAPGGARWSSAREFQIVNDPPTISFNTANGSSADRIESRDRYWTFQGAANDPESQLNRIEWRCDGDNCGSQTSSSGLSNWTYIRDNLEGRNDIRFVAYDNQGNRSNESRHLDLNIDRTAPATSLSLNGEGNAANWPAWFTIPVTVRLHADDGATGRARVGVREIHYRIDGGAWQIPGGSDTVVTVDSDGTHTIEYYAVDNVGNQESTRSTTFRVDRTPPTVPTGIVETHGVPNNQWQKVQNVASFTWTASSDATSGLWGYQFYFGTDPAGQSNQSFLAADPPAWTPQPGGVRTGTHYLRGRTRDIAGNWSVWTNLFTYRYDGTPPENPSGITHAAGITNDAWQRTSNLADFVWPVPHDEGSGIQGYSMYWGGDPAGASSSFITANGYQWGTPLCGTNEACIGYLRLRSRDNVDNEPADWTTAFVLRYDNAPPVADFTFSEGITTTQTLVHLQINATDAGSGLSEMRLSGDGTNWTSWEVYADERLWTIPAISRQWWPVYLQVRDAVGLPSAVISQTIYLDVNPQQPRSASFRLFDYAMSAGAGEHTSTTYNGRSTIGQILDSAVVTSTGYILRGGYEAGSQALPIIEPGHDEFSLVNGIFASGSGGNTLTSGAFRMVGTLGEIGVPNNETVLTSTQHRLQPGFLAAALPVATPAPTPTPGPTPTPIPPPACEFPTITIDDAALFTNDTNVALSICAPSAAEMMISNDGGFGGAAWEPYAESKAWTITTYGQYVLPRFVYVAFREANGTVHSTYFDDIIYDPNPPAGTIAVGGDGVTAQAVVAAISGERMPELASAGAGSGVVALRSGATVYVRQLQGINLAQPVALLAPQDDGAVDIYVTANDDNSGLAEMQISASGVFSDTTWEQYSALTSWQATGQDGIKTIYARFKDSAGNVSETAEASFALDTMQPIGGMALSQSVIGPDTTAITLSLGAEDNLSGVTDMRVSTDPTFTDVAWLPYTTALTWPVALSDTNPVTLYAQYRDLAGNVSETYDAAYVTDTTPPMLYVEVDFDESLVRDVHIFGYDELATLDSVRLSNDPLMFEGGTTLPYTEMVTWTFDERRVVWIQVSDNVGNWTEPYPAYASPVMAPAAPTTTISLETDGMTLSWTHLSANAHYEVWRDSRPAFNPSMPTTDTIKLDNVYPDGGATLSYTDTTADPDENCYYTVLGVNSLGQVSAPSNYTGVFRFLLTPGQ